MSLAYEAETARMMLAEAHQEHTVTTAHGFELRAPSSLMPELVELFTDPIWDAGSAPIRRYITGFAVFRFPIRIPKQPISDWIFVKAHKPMPTAENLLYYALRRVVLLRYQRAGVPIHLLNRRSIITRARRFADYLWQRYFPNEVA